MRRAFALGLFCVWAASSCGGGSWECGDDEALSSYDGKCTLRATAEDRDDSSGASGSGAGAGKGGSATGSGAGSGSGGATGAGSGTGGGAGATSAGSANTGGGGTNDATGGNDGTGANGDDDAGTEPPVDPRVEAHGRACMNETDCSPLAPLCSMRLGEACPTTGCCISKGCDLEEPDSCPVAWKCEFISFAAATYCVPE